MHVSSPKNGEQIETKHRKSDRTPVRARTNITDQTYRTEEVYTTHLSIYYLVLTAVTLFLYSYITKCHGGWMDRFVGVTAVVRTAALL